MDNKKDNKYYINRIIEDIEFLLKNTKGCQLADLKSNLLLIDSIMFRLIQISENSNKLDDSFKEKYKDIPWKFIKGIRNRIVHDYGEVDMTIIYNTITISIPKLYFQIKSIEKEL